MNRIERYLEATVRKVNEPLWAVYEQDNCLSDVRAESEDSAIQKVQARLGIKDGCGFFAIRIS